MLTIKKLSSTGFQTMNNTWYSVDVFKILKNKNFKFPFESLKIGDRIDNIKLQTGKNNKEYVIDFIVLPHEDIGVKENSPLLSTQQSVSLKSSPSPIKVPLELGCDMLEREGKKCLVPLNTPSVQDNINFSLALKLAFNSTSLNGFLSEEEWMDYTFKRAEKILIRINKRCLR